VQAMADGYPTIENYRKRLDGDLLRRLQRSYGVAYHAGIKAIVGVQDGDVRTFRLESTSGATPASGGGLDRAAIRATDAAREVADHIRRAAEGTVDSSVEDRLRSWGYI
jgi:hypothetical protein